MMFKQYPADEKPFPPEEDQYPICPVCGKECETVYKYKKIIVGCDNCIQEENAWEEPECMEVGA